MEIDGQVIVLIIFVLISAVKWLMEKIRGEQPLGTTEELEDIYEEFREEIRHRQTATHQQPTPPPIPQAPPPATRPAERFKKPRKPKLSAEEKAALARYQQRTSGTRTHKPNSRTPIQNLLSTPNSARQAIILTEILGKPKSLHRSAANVACSMRRPHHAGNSSR